MTPNFMYSISLQLSKNLAVKKVFGRKTLNAVNLDDNEEIIGRYGYCMYVVGR